tara:strand:- start:2729 stop:3514 length:786 start_codon:yes stop_codon:yes gene_type:complete
MAIKDTIEFASGQFANAQEKVIKRLVKDIMELNAALSRDELLTIMSSIDIANYMLTELGFQNEIDKLLNSYENLLIDTPFFATISEGSLGAMQILEESTYFAHVTQISNAVRLETLKGVIAGKSESAIKKTITAISGLRKDQAQVLANTSMNNFSRSVIKQQMDEADPNQKYVYSGVIDGRTRDICLAMGSAGALTRDQIVEQYGEGVLLDGGGFNCRHQWTPLTSSSNDLTDTKKASDLIEERGSKFDPITLEELYENKA